MKQITFAFTVSVLLLVSCRTGNVSTQTVLVAENLKSAFISLNADSAYTLRTPKGAILRIEKNSFSTDAKQVNFEIKEAYSIQDMLLAGLTTESNGNLLESGGMIYINATANNNKVELLKPVQISLPGEIYDNKMQLFKGELNADGNINWVNPVALDTSPVLKRLLKGEQLFKATCASCHKSNKEFTGPALAKCREREPDKDWAYRFTQNPSLLRLTDAYAKEIASKYKPTIMTAFPNITKEEVNAILDYCDNEDLKFPNTGEITAQTTPSIPTDFKISDSVNPCLTADTIYYSTTANNPAIEIISGTIDTMPTNLINNSGLSPSSAMEGLREGFTDNVGSSKELYMFSIQTFGWYNVDAQVEGYLGTSLVKIDVQLQMTLESEMHVYLFCPDKKLLSVSNTKENNNYSFDKIDGKIPLFINDHAIVLAFGSIKNKFFYGTASFNIQSEQTSVIKLKETTEQEFKSFIELNKIDGIKIDIEKKEMIYQPISNSSNSDSAIVEMDIIKIPCISIDSAGIKNK